MNLFSVPVGRVMTEKKSERLFRTRRLTPEEIARDREIRSKVEKEFPPLKKAPFADPGGLSEALKSAAQCSGKSINQLAREAGVSPIVVSRFLSGERDIRLATADKLARALGIALAAR
jgi:antitoxin component HigA of HigAB toxin-antitoxin module